MSNLSIWLLSAIITLIIILVSYFCISRKRFQLSLKSKDCDYADLIKRCTNLLTTKKPTNQDTIAIDFDGVIHKYSKGWQDGSIYDGPVEGALEAMEELYNKGFKIIIHTTRQDTKAIHEFIIKWQMERNGVTCPFEIHNVKPYAIAYIDDRAIRFTTWKDMLNYF